MESIPGEASRIGSQREEPGSGHLGTFNKKVKDFLPVLSYTMIASLLILSIPAEQTELGGFERYRHYLASLEGYR